MSFILDALRKSEHERQRAALPGIAQVPFGLPRREIPRWAIAVMVVLAVAVLALGAAWWRSTARDVPATIEADPARVEIPLTLPPTSVAAPPATVPSALPSPERADEVEPPDTPPAVPPRRTAATAPAAPLEAPAPREEPPPAAEDLSLPSAEALAAQGVALPALRLELHAYSPRPAERFVFINGTKYAEGATLAEGPRLVTIAPSGAVLVYLGNRFLLAPQ